ncbi:MAG TPA: formate-dependent phosphoribosylglycinamide formyltransferase [Casimicrobiaceae bacterium]|nr:formate-dependent phosphoribosylglycinamide formyltransferase [Casimicrobiaceae bacterium]
MHIGTPLSPSATRVMLLGSGELGKEMIIELQRLGIEVVAVDRYANAPGHQVAHRAHVIALSDAAALRRLIEQERPQIVVPEIEGLAVDALMSVERDRIAEVIPNARAVRLTANRETTRRLAAETLQLPTVPYRVADTLPDLERAIEGRRSEPGIGYPAIVKPVLSWSGKGQTVVRDKSEIAAAWQYAESSARVRGSRILVEQFIEFDYEMTLLVVRSERPDGSIATQCCDPIGHRGSGGDYVESWQPQEISDAARARAEEIATRITDELGGRGVFDVELFVRNDDVWLSDVAPRPPDTALVTLCTQVQSAFELHARAMLRLPVDVSLREPGASAVIQGGIEGRGIRYEDVAHALEVPRSNVRLFGKPEAYKRRRMGVALANGRDVAEARQRASECASRVHPRA